MHFAARGGFEQQVADLLKEDCDWAEECNSKLRTPLHLAAKYGRDKVVELFLSNYFEVQQED